MASASSRARRSSWARTRSPTSPANWSTRSRERPLVATWRRCDLVGGPEAEPGCGQQIGIPLGQIATSPLMPHANSSRRGRRRRADTRSGAAVFCRANHVPTRRPIRNAVHPGGRSRNSCRSTDSACGTSSGDGLTRPRPRQTWPGAVPSSSAGCASRAILDRFGPPQRGTAGQLRRTRRPPRPPCTASQPRGRWRPAAHRGSAVRCCRRSSEQCVWAAVVVSAATAADADGVPGTLLRRLDIQLMRVGRRRAESCVHRWTARRSGPALR